MRGSISSHTAYFWGDSFLDGRNEISAGLSPGNEQKIRC